MDKDYYKILDLPKDSSEGEIKKQYRKLALKYHPDRAPEDKKKEYGDKFKEISQAYRVLSNKEKRAQYDQYGQNFENGGPSGRGFSQQDFHSFYDAFGGEDAFEDLGFSRIFEQMFGFGSRSKRAQNGNDLSIDLEITLKDSFHGLEKEIDLNKIVSCSECEGKGGRSLKKCSVCQGTGHQQTRQQSILGFIIQQMPCSECHGRGEVPEEKCKKCHGEGVVKENQKIKITIPAGIDHGQSLKMSQQGEAAPYGGRAGDLFVNIYIKDNSDFERQGSNLFYDLVINFTQAALGDKIQVPTVDGKVNLKIPQGTQSGEIFELKGQGMPGLYNRGKGSLFVKVQLKTPKNLSRQQKKLIKELELN